MVNNRSLAWFSTLARHTGPLYKAEHDNAFTFHFVCKQAITHISKLFGNYVPFHFISDRFVMKLYIYLFKSQARQLFFGVWQSNHIF